MDFDNQKLRDGIIAKLKEYDAYIDNELPDYIVVMLANKKTILQINNDLQLFLGKNTEQFTQWLRKVVSSPELLDEPKEESDEGKEGKKVDELSEGEASDGSDEEVVNTQPKVVTLPGGKQKKTNTDIIELHIQESQEDTLSPGDLQDGEVLSGSKLTKSAERIGHGGRTERVKTETSREGQRSRLTLRKKAIRVQPDSTRDQDLRAFIAQRREERVKHRRSDEERGRYDEEMDESEDEKEKVSTSLPSVVKLIKRPRHSEEGGSRLFQRAFLGLGRKKSNRGEPTTAGSKVKAGGSPPKEEVGVSGGVTRKIIRVKREELNRILAPLKSPVKTTSSHTVSQVTSTEVLEDQRQEENKEEQEVEGTAESGDDSDPGDQVVIELEREEEEEDRELQDQIERATLAAVKSVLPVAARLGRKRKSSELSDLRELLTKNKSSKTDSTRFVVTLDGAGKSYKPQTKAEGTTEQDEYEDEGIQGGEEEVTGQSSVAERCRFWPNCKNGDSCVYVHPSVPCKLFPNCKYGKKCLYVHPQCKFDARCTRPDCPYLHTAPRHLSFKQNVIPIPPPPVFKPKFNPSFSYARGSPSSSGQRFPNKAALTWTPNKDTHVSERSFAVPDNQTSSLPV